MQKSIIETIVRRRSVRSYTAEQLTDGELEEILKAGRYAPSGGNSQSTVFIVVQNRQTLRELSLLAEREFAQMVLRDDLYKSLRTSIKLSKKGGYDFTYGAPTLIITANKRDYCNCMADCAVAVENMLLAATSLNIASCWVNQLTWLTDHAPVRAYLKKLGLGDDEQVCAAAVFGHTDARGFPALDRTGNPVIYVK